MWKECYSFANMQTLNPPKKIKQLSWLFSKGVNKRINLGLLLKCNFHIREFKQTKKNI